jgi:hypothetical protein
LALENVWRTACSHYVVVTSRSVPTKIERPFFFLNIRV